MTRTHELGPRLADVRRMFKRALAFGLVALPACTTNVGTTSQDIIGGTTTQSADWKAVVALEDAPGQWFCTGTLITDTWVLTAAHCMDGETVAKLHVRFDTNDSNSTTQGHAVAVAEIHSDPDFDYNKWDNDVALIKLAAPVTDRTPTPIDRDLIAFGTSLTDVGYGDADNNNGGGGTLRKVVKTTADCAGANDPGILNDNLLCFDASDGKGSCYGDSGGPTYITVNGALQVAGITSGGSGDACGAGWDLYTAVHAELAYIDGVMNGTTTPPPDPGGDGSGSGSGSGDGSGSGSGSGDQGNNHGESSGCNAAGGSSSALLVFALGAIVRRRRREAKPAE